MTIPIREISVVVQGPIVGKPHDLPEARLTAACLGSIRQRLPGTEVILSTWQGADTTGLDFDVVVESVDPGAVCYFRDRSTDFYNVNRQIRSTSAGLDRVSRPFAIKIRTDMRIEGRGFIELFEQFPKRHADWQVFKQRLVVCDLITQHPNRTGFAFSPSDWFHFGRTEDVKRLWNVALDEGNQVARYYENRPRPSPWRMPGMISRYTQEQYIWLAALRSHGPVAFDHSWDDTAESRWLTDVTFANNLIIADEARLGVRFCKYRPLRLYELISYTHADWLALYKKYCDPDYPTDSGVSRWWFHNRTKLEILSRKLWFRLPIAVRAARRFFTSDG